MMWNTASPQTSYDIVSLLGISTRFVGGSLKANHDVRIDGEVSADIEVQGRAVISKSGTVQGRIVATNLVVAGQVDGIDRPRHGGVSQ